MGLSIARVRRHLARHDFRPLFVEELGWDHARDSQSLDVEGVTYLLQAIAQKRGMVAYLCQPNALPEYRLRRRIERQLSRRVQEHIIIFTDSAKAVQVWQWVRQEPGRPVACREHRYTRGQPGDSLIQKLESIAFSLDEEEGINLVDVTGRVRAAFDVEQVTKRFYDRFQAEQKAFGKFIAGVPKGDELNWYISVMLNRLMFIYFIQKKGFLNGDLDYLRSGLAKAQQQASGSYYQEFLKLLFFEGFALRPAQRSAKARALLGAVPYLNGGLFLPHSIELAHPDIDIPDKAFERLLAFFDQYQWHLDDRPLRSDNEINPDVLGYIFEKYINQKQMGAYYTKEDITEYITKDTVIPFLLDRVKEACPSAFAPVSKSVDSVWTLLRDDPDRYIPPEMRYGVEVILPPEIAVGLEDVSQRHEWNRPATSEAGLPTELWRETVSRRQRYREVRDYLASGSVSTIDDLITLNLDVRQFAQDVIESTTDPHFLSVVWEAVTTVTILDPTCGSGAFLFAALNILEPLYEACLSRMEGFTEERAPLQRELARFDEVLDHISHHPNQRYFILKTIMVANLYGVDIMAEAVEIARLRLFLKLVAQVDEVESIEPLPDIDFNIRAGNTLVGFAVIEEVERAMKVAHGGQGKLMFGEDVDTLQRIEEKAAEVDRLFEEFKALQMSDETQGDLQYSAAKKEALGQRLMALDTELSRYLAQEYGVDVGNRGAYQHWLASYQPFHWFVGFYGILRQGGFDVILGNPPYVEYSAVRRSYTVKGYQTDSCSNLYPFVVERSFKLLGRSGLLSMILPLSAFCTRRMEPLVETVKGSATEIWVSHYGWRPAKFFDGVNIPLSILICRRNGSDRGAVVYTTEFTKWYQEKRSFVLPILQYANSTQFLHFDFIVPKVAPEMVSILAKVFWKARRVGDYCASGRTPYVLYYRNTGGLYWRITTDFSPYFARNGVRSHSSTESTLYFRSRESLALSLALTNSNLFWLYYVAFSSFHHVNSNDILDVPIDFGGMGAHLRHTLLELSSEVMGDLRRNSTVGQRKHRGGALSEFQTFYPAKSKAIIDEIDRALALHYGFTDEELDFIINYDIKYRMGDELYEEGDEGNEDM